MSCKRLCHGPFCRPFPFPAGEILILNKVAIIKKPIPGEGGDALCSFGDLFTFMQTFFMKRITIAFCAACLLVACNDNKEEPRVAAATTTEAAAPEPAIDSATMAKNWEAYLTPGEPHKLLASTNGTWDADITMWMSPDAPPSKSKGTTVSEMIYGGRYQQARHTGEFNGMPFEGLNTMAYDNHKKVYLSTWIDNMGTGIMYMEGPWDAATSTMNLKGKMIDPGTGKDLEMRETFQILDNNNQLVSMYCKGPDGKEYKTMEIKYTRKK